MVVNAIGTCVTFLMVNCSNRSVPSSFVPLPLYIHAPLSFIFTFCKNFTTRALPSSSPIRHTVFLVLLFIWCYCLLGAPSPIPSLLSLFYSLGKYPSP